jgi:quercetin dioxygenase-like cupin family protein
MRGSYLGSGGCVAGVMLLAAGTLLVGAGAPAAGADAGAKVTPVIAEQLPNVPGKTLTAVVVTYAPGGKSGKHHHAGSVFAYVLSGAIRSQVSTGGPAKVYQAGESFFEPPGSEHLVSENASAPPSPRACSRCSWPTTAPSSRISISEGGVDK